MNLLLSQERYDVLSTRVGTSRHSAAVHERVASAGADDDCIAVTDRQKSHRYVSRERTQGKGDRRQERGGCANADPSPTTLGQRECAKAEVKGERGRSSD